jgi:hypothetical protein
MDCLFYLLNWYWSYTNFCTKIIGFYFSIYLSINLISYRVFVYFPLSCDSNILSWHRGWQRWLPAYKCIAFFCRISRCYDCCAVVLGDARYFSTSTRVKSNCTIPRLSLLGFRPVYTVRATFIAYGVLSISSPYRLGSFAPTCFTLFVCRHTNTNGK